MRTRRALADVDLGHAGDEVLRVLLRCAVFRRHVQRSFGLCEPLPAGVGQQPVVANALDAAGQDVLHEAGNAAMIYTHVLKAAAGGTASPLDSLLQV